MSVVYGKHHRLVAGHRRQMHRRRFEHVLDLHARFERPHGARGSPSPSLTVRNITSASADGETTLGATPPEINPTV